MSTATLPSQISPTRFSSEDEICIQSIPLDFADACKLLSFFILRDQELPGSTLAADRSAARQIECRLASLLTDHSMSGLKASSSCVQQLFSLSFRSSVPERSRMTFMPISSAFGLKLSSGTYS